MAGFGDVDGLKSLGFPHRLPDLDAIISLIVKVLLLSYLDVEQTPTIALHSHRRKYNEFRLPKIFQFSGLLQQISVIQATGALWGGLKACCYLESEASLSQPHLKLCSCKAKSIRMCPRS